jgi:hypothetical protein
VGGTALHAPFGQDPRLTRPALQSTPQTGAKAVTPGLKHANYWLRRGSLAATWTPGLAHDLVLGGAADAITLAGGSVVEAMLACFFVTVVRGGRE